jgi:hypothetical protein
MAIAFLAHNGIGLGHLSRAAVLCDALSSAGFSPVIFAQGYLPEWVAEKYPGKRVEVLWRLGAAEKTRVAAEIANYVSLSEPAVVFEDTHPEPVELPPRVGRVLVVRPGVLSHMRSLQERHHSTYKAFLIADSPGSPTWPYAADETEEILSWENWHYIGPVYTRARQEERDAVAARYAFGPGQRLCVFTTGGGGKQEASGDDIRSFVARAEAIAGEILSGRPEARLLFVKGPYFPTDVDVPGVFETVEVEPCMPGLLSLAHGAVIRPGYNTTWECIQGKTPFVPLLSTSFKEPMEERLSTLRAHGLLVEDLPRLFNGPGGDESFALACERVISRWGGRPDGGQIGRLIKGWARKGVRRLAPRPSVRTATTASAYDPEAVRRFGEELDGVSSDAAFVIRVDDVVSIDENLDWLLRTLINLRLPASLEIIPYLADLRERELDAYDRDNLIEVSQHGHAHMPHWTAEDGKHEFPRHSALPSRTNLRRLADGLRSLSRAFPGRFRGGFSPPFDSLPTWLGPSWRDLGGRYLSLIWARPVGVMLPFVRVSTEVWDWQTGNPVTPTAVLDNLLGHLLRTGTAGLVIHPQLLADESLRENLSQLFGLLAGCGISCRPPSSVAASQAETSSRVNRVRHVQGRA